MVSGAKGNGMGTVLAPRRTANVATGNDVTGNGVKAIDVSGARMSAVTEIDRRASVGKVHAMLNDVRVSAVMVIDPQVNVGKARAMVNAGRETAVTPRVRGSVEKEIAGKVIGLGPTSVVRRARGSVATVIGRVRNSVVRAMENGLPSAENSAKANGDRRRVISVVLRRAIRN